MPIHELIIRGTSYRLQQTSATPQTAPELNSLQYIGINKDICVVFPLSLVVLFCTSLDVPVRMPNITPQRNVSFGSVLETMLYS